MLHGHGYGPRLAPSLGFKLLNLKPVTQRRPGTESLEAPRKWPQPGASSFSALASCEMDSRSLMQLSNPGDAGRRRISKHWESLHSQQGPH